MTWLTEILHRKAAILHKSFKNAKNPGYGGYQCRFSSMVKIFSQKDF